MHIRHLAIAAVITAIATTAAACNDDGSGSRPGRSLAAERSQEPAGGGSEPSEFAESGGPAESGGAEEAASETAAVGDTVTLRGQDSGERIAVSLKRWTDDAKASDAFMAPPSGKRWVAGQFEFVNVGSVTYADSPGNGAQAADTQGQRFTATVSGGITAGPEMTAALKLPVGEKALGWIVFEVPKASKIVSVQCALDSGFAEQTGQWAVR